MNSKALYISRKVLYRQAVLLVPVVSLFVVVMITLFEVHRFRQSGRELTVAKKQIVQIESLIKDLDAKPLLTVTPVILQSPVEQPDFIDVLRSRAEVSHVTLIRWANSSGPVSPGATGGASPMPAEVSSINCTIESAGTYNDLRHFLYSLQDAPRLFTLSDMVWSRNDKWPITTLKFNLARYITSIGTAPVHIPAPVKATAESPNTVHPVVDSSVWSTPNTPKPLNPFPNTGYLSPSMSKVADSRGSK